MWKKYYTMTKISKAIFDRHPDWRDKFWQFVRFGVVGTVSSAIHYGVYCLVLLVANANISFTWTQSDGIHKKACGWSFVSLETIPGIFTDHCHSAAVLSGNEMTVHNNVIK